MDAAHDALSVFFKEKKNTPWYISKEKPFKARKKEHLSEYHKRNPLKVRRKKDPMHIKLKVDIVITIKKAPHRNKI